MLVIIQFEFHVHDGGISFQDRLAVYVRENLKLYLEEQWSNAECTEFVTALREQVGVL